MPATPAIIALDWGTSSLRAYLLDDAGGVIDSRSEPQGIMQIRDGHLAAVYDAVTAGWPAVTSIASGMIGSANGWVEAPYCAAPAGADELSATLTSVPNTRLRIVPGVATDGEHPDVMRGEETQIVGALELHPELASRSLLVLPGTHSKWVQVVDGRITSITTFMTGELFALLREHSILGRNVAGHSGYDDAFSRGVLAAEASPEGIASLLFTVRSLVLVRRLAAEASLEYLSGLLIGDEIRCGLINGTPPDALIGETALCDRYLTALQLFGVPVVPVIDGAAQAGLFSIASRAGLTRSTQ